MYLCVHMHMFICLLIHIYIHTYTMYAIEEMPEEPAEAPSKEDFQDFYEQVRKAAGMPDKHKQKKMSQLAADAASSRLRPPSRSGRRWRPSGRRWRRQWRRESVSPPRGASILLFTAAPLWAGRSTGDEQARATKKSR